MIHTDLCIVGAGAAGITLAREFANAPFKVLLLESGGMKFNHRTQFLYKAQNIGREYEPMEFTKRRQFGGSTVTWFGRCRPLDQLDFEARSWIPYSGWPFDKPHLDPFYARAKDYCQLVSDNYNVKDDYFSDGAAETKRFYFSPPTNFGETYKTDLMRADNIDILLNANVVHIGLDQDGGKVKKLVCKTMGGKSIHVSARVFILAASALENTRLLLVSRDVHANGIGNQHDLVGRFFMEHPHIFTGRVETLPSGFPKQFTKLNYDFEQKNLGVADAIGLRQDVMRRENLPNGCVFLVDRPLHKTEELYYSDAASGFISLMEILQHSAPPNAGIVKNALHAARNIRSVSSLMISALNSRMKKKRQFAPRLQMETVPNPESRVTLSQKRDALGEPQVSLNWNTVSQDVDGYQRFDNILREELAKKGLYVKKINHDLSPDGWPISMRPAKHALGTTRMHKNEKQGVVDEHCRVHGVSNLFIAGGSVFPTSGMANPTLTIIALAIRLADHIKREMASSI